MPTEPTPAEWGTIPDAAARLRVSTKTVRRMIARGDIYAERIGPRLIRINMGTIGGQPMQHEAGDAL